MGDGGDDGGDDVLVVVPPRVLRDALTVLSLSRVEREDMVVPLPLPLPLQALAVETGLGGVLPWSARVLPLRAVLWPLPPECPYEYDCLPSSATVDQVLLLPRPDALGQVAALRIRWWPCCCWSSGRRRTWLRLRRCTAGGRECAV